MTQQDQKIVQNELPCAMDHAQTFYCPKLNTIIIMGAVNNCNIYSFKNEKFTQINEYTNKFEPSGHNTCCYVDTNTKKQNYRDGDGIFRWNCMAYSS